jgi:hypothetical protein
VSRGTERHSLVVFSLSRHARQVGSVRRLVLLTLLVTLIAPSARGADDGIVRMSRELRNNEDFRVRTQAALALGASKDKRAVAPLCEGLEDSNTTVRAAAAAGIGKLALGGADCLKGRLEYETSASVKSVIEKAIEKVRSAQKPSVTTETRYYVAVGPTTDKTGRGGAEIDDMVRAALEQKTAGLEGYVVAPRDESAIQAKAVTQKFKNLKAFFLWPKVLPPEYSGGKLTVKFEIAVFTYPGKAMKGTIPLKLTMSDMTSVDKATEDDLIRRAADSAFERFAGNADRFAQ